MLRSLAASVLTLFVISSAHAETRAAAGSSTSSEVQVTPQPATTPSATTPLAKKPAKAEVPTSIAVLIAYQRVGHDLLALQEQRGVFDCGDLMPRFRAIKLEDALATPAARTAAAASLADLAAQVERYRGIHLEQACLDNPLAAGCQ